MEPQLATSGESVEEVTCDAAIVGAFTSDTGVALSASAKALDDALDGYLTEHLRETSFKAKIGEITIVPTMRRMPAKRIAIVGLGPQQDVGPGVVRRAAGTVVRRLSDAATIASTLHESIGRDEGTSATVEGLLLGSYRFTRYKSDPRPSKIERMVLLDASDEAVERGRLFADATRLARDLINEPAGALTPIEWAERVTRIAAEGGLECKIWDESELTARGFGGLLGVAQGSTQPPRLIELRYTPKNPKGKIALIGKGITFDSGGLSLKDAKGMETMKTDMSGGAAVVAAMSVLGRLGPNIEVLALVPATENMPSGSAIKPGDVISHYGDHTSEVLNTDAEGRLVLADALAYACEQNVDAVVDAATLTGAIMVALGTKSTGLFCNDDALAAELESASQAAGERVWRMPLYDDYRGDLDSEVADVKNSGPRWGGAIMAALFLRDFIPEGQAWAHLDIAGMARAESDYDEITKGGSGVATRTFLHWIEARARAK